MPDNASPLLKFENTKNFIELVDHALFKQTGTYATQNGHEFTISEDPCNYSHKIYDFYLHTPKIATLMLTTTCAVKE